MHIFDKIEIILNEKNISWSNIATRIGESEQRLCNIRRRKSKVDFELICKITIALNINLNNLNIYKLCQ